MILAALALAAAAPLLATHEETLPNGLRVVGHRMDTELAAIHLEIPRGAADDPPDRPGLAHLVEHLAYEAPAGAPENDFDRRLEDVGGASGAWTTHDALGFEIDVPADALPYALALESERLARFAPTEAALANQRAVVAREAAPSERLDRVRAALALLLWGRRHPYGHTVLGSGAALAGLSLAEVTAAARDLLRLDGAVLVVVGPAPAEALVAEARRAFAGVGAPRVEPPAPRPPPSFPSVPARAWVDVDLSPVRLRVAWRTVPVTSDHAEALGVVAALLADALAGTGFDVRHWAGDDAGSLLVSADTLRPGSALARITRAARRLAASGPTGRDLARVRATLRTRELEELTSAAGRARVLADCARTLGVADCLPARWAARERVGVAAARRTALRYLDPDDAVVLAGDARRAPLHDMVEVEP